MGPEKKPGKEGKNEDPGHPLKDVPERKNKPRNFVCAAPKRHEKNQTRGEEKEPSQNGRSEANILERTPLVSRTAVDFGKVEHAKREASRGGDGGQLKSRN